eukprot:403355303
MVEQQVSDSRPILGQGNKQIKAIQSMQKLQADQEEDIFENSIKEEDLNDDFDLHGKRKTSDDFRQAFQQRIEDYIPKTSNQPQNKNSGKTFNYANTPNQDQQEDSPEADQFERKMRSVQNRPTHKVQNHSQNNPKIFQSLNQEKLHNLGIGTNSSQQLGSIQQQHLLRSNSEYVNVQKKNASINREIFDIEPQQAIEQGLNTIFEEKDGKIFDTLREKAIKLENDIKFYGENYSTEQIYEDSHIEQNIWDTIEGQNCNSKQNVLQLYLVTIFGFGHTTAEIYNEQINDLLSPNNQRTNGSNLDKVTEEICINIDQIFSLVRMGDINRQIGSTKNNLDRSSKANLIFRLIIETFSHEMMIENHNKIYQSVINLVDLAGSEALNEKEDPDRNSQQQREATIPIKSILTLEQVVTILSEGNEMNEWIPYRESKLTRFLMPYLEGNSKIIWLFNISPCDQFYRVNKKTIEFANKIPQIKQQVKTNTISFQSSYMHQTKKQIKILKQSLESIDQYIQKKTAIQQRNGHPQKLQDFDKEIDEKVRLNNEIKKLSDQILVSDKVAFFMKKFDRTRSSVGRSENTNQMSTRRSSLFARMSKRVDNAKNYIQKYAIENEDDFEANDFQNYLDPNRNSSLAGNRRSSTKNKMRRTIKAIRQPSQVEAKTSQNDQEQQEKDFNVGRLTFLDQMMETQNTKSDMKYLSNNMLNLNDDNLLDDMEDFTKTPLGLLTQNSDIFEQAFQNASSQSKDPKQVTQNDLNNIDDDSLLDEEEIEQDDLEDEQPQKQSKPQNSSQKYQPNKPHIYEDEEEDEDIFYAIQEEDEAEDSFEREKREKREKQQNEYEQKIDELERNFGESFLSTMPNRENKTIVTQPGMLEDNEEPDFLSRQSLLPNNDDDDDEDLLQNFDGIPKQSIIDRLDQHRDSIQRPEFVNRIRRETINLRNQTEVQQQKQQNSNNLLGIGSQRKTAILGNQALLQIAQSKNDKNVEDVKVQVDDNIGQQSYICGNCQQSIQDDSLKKSMQEADKQFLENLLFTKEREIDDLNSELMQKDIQVQKLSKDKNDLLNYILELEKQITEISGSQIFSIAGLDSGDSDKQKQKAFSHL